MFNNMSGLCQRSSSSVVGTEAGLEWVEIKGKQVETESLAEKPPVSHYLAFAKFISHHVLFGSYNLIIKR